MRKLIFLAGGFAVAVVATGLYRLSGETLNGVIISDLRLVPHFEGETTFLVETGHEIFRNSDDLVFWKFHSSDTQGTLQIGEQYTFHVAGWQVPVFMKYRNIIGVEPEDRRQELVPPSTEPTLETVVISEFD